MPTLEVTPAVVKLVCETALAHWNVTDNPITVLPTVEPGKVCIQYGYSKDEPHAAFIITKPASITHHVERIIQMSYWNRFATDTERQKFVRKLGKYLSQLNPNHVPYRHG